MPRDILARDAAILIRACASNERRSVDARVGLNLRRLLVARKEKWLPRRHNRRRRTSTSVLAVDDDLLEVLGCATQPGRPRFVIVTVCPRVQDGRRK